MKKENIRVARIHICLLEKTNENQIKVDIQKYPDRLCVIDEERNIAIDVKTKHQYPYIRTVNRLYFTSAEEIKKIKYGKRNACFEYDNFMLYDLTLEDLESCDEIINQIKQGIIFIDGNEVLTNEEYLNMLENDKKQNKNKKMSKKRS